MSGGRSLPSWPTRASRCALAGCAVALFAAGARAEDKQPFGPFDAGAVRDVVRQGQKGKARHAHPAVGDAAKVPGEGPPPPPLRMDPDIPELALDKGPGRGPNVVGPGLSSSPLYLASLGYANLITKIDGPRCTHLPTCSRFGAQAVARHGLLGIVMTLDRVIAPSESTPIRRFPEVEGWGGTRVYDPITNYEFWHAERFTGLPPHADEQPLELPPLPQKKLARATLPAIALPKSDASDHPHETP